MISEYKLKVKDVHQVSLQSVKKHLALKSNGYQCDTEIVFNCVYQKELPFWTVLLDSWYITKDMMLQIERLGKIYYCPPKDNR
mgnify:CR=1 FL=1